MVLFEIAKVIITCHQGNDTNKITHKVDNSYITHLVTGSLQTKIEKNGGKIKLGFLKSFTMPGFVLELGHLVMREKSKLNLQKKLMSGLDSWVLGCRHIALRT